MIATITDVAIHIRSESSQSNLGEMEEAVSLEPKVRGTNGGRCRNLVFQEEVCYPNDEYSSYKSNE
jgi:hypothetical protein